MFKSESLRVLTMSFTFSTQKLFFIAVKNMHFRAESTACILKCFALYIKEKALLPNLTHTPHNSCLLLSYLENND